VQALRDSDQTATADLLERLAAGPQLVIVCLLGSDSAPASIAEAYLKLHLLSHRLAKPNSLNLEGLFSTLVNIAWTNQGAIDLIDLPGRQLEARLQGLNLEIMSVDKFPRMTAYVVPAGVRIAHTARVRLGAYLGEGTTIMHEGFVNFNAGTEGPAMIEGRISAGVMVGANSDLGGGCSTMGTLSGGGKEIISVGRNCLIGANAGIGFPLADGCIIEAGLYVTAGTKVRLLDANGELQKTVKAKELGGQGNLLYRRNSLSGTVECIPLKTTSQLNQDLHSHN
jgi:2,3,4,5-tetrahydropyridine-2-carboxylate N-succinyltransferase